MNVEKDALRLATIATVFIWVGWLGVLFAAFGAVFGMLGLNRLPMHHHPLFSSKVFERVTDDAFFISIESWDPRFDASATGKLLESLGARNVELLESE